MGGGLACLVSAEMSLIVEIPVVRLQNYQRSHEGQSLHGSVEPVSSFDKRPHVAEPHACIPSRRLLIWPANGEYRTPHSEMLSPSEECAATFQVERLGLQTEGS
jgi:hypothetical protein